MCNSNLYFRTFDVNLGFFNTLQASHRSDVEILQFLAGDKTIG